MSDTEAPPMVSHFFVRVTAAQHNPDRWFVSLLHIGAVSSFGGDLVDDGYVIRKWPDRGSWPVEDIVEAEGWRFELDEAMHVALQPIIDRINERH